LTGFKWLAKIPNLRFGYEEALGYAVDAISVNDKDGISAALLLAQCAAELKRDGHTMAGYLKNIWETYGYHGTEQISIRVSNIAQVDKVLERIRNHHPESLSGIELTRFIDLSQPEDDLPSTNGVTMWFGENIRVIVRPSGTEAKLKCYIEVCAASASSKDISEVNSSIASLKKELLGLLTV
jgi:phosphomannomutase